MIGVYLTSDLLFSSRVVSAAKSMGLTMSVVNSPSDMRTAAESGRGHLFLIDLTTPGLHPLQLIPELRELSPLPITIVAYGPHVDTAGIAGARQAGCDAVYTRGQFSSQMSETLRRYGCSV